MEIVHTHMESKEKLIRNWHTLLGQNWANTLKDTLQSEYMDHLIFYMNEQYKKNKVNTYPYNPRDVWNPFRFTNFEEVKVVILNNQPGANAWSNGIGIGEYKSNKSNSGYHTKMISLTSCLKNNYDTNVELFDTKLEHWTKQGVLFLNTSLISELGEEDKHQIIFRNFIREVICALSEHHYGLVFVFTSNVQSIQFKKYIDKKYHHIIEKKSLTDDVQLFEEINELITDEKGKGERIIW